MMTNSKDVVSHVVTFGNPQWSLSLLIICIANRCRHCEIWQKYIQDNAHELQNDVILVTSNSLRNLNHPHIRIYLLFFFSEKKSSRCKWSKNIPKWKFHDRRFLLLLLVLLLFYFEILISTLTVQQFDSIQNALKKPPWKEEDFFESCWGVSIGMYLGSEKLQQADISGSLCDTFRHCHCALSRQPPHPLQG